MFDGVDFSIVINPGILEETYVPSSISGRDEQVNEIAFCLSPASRNNRPLHLWVHGKPGAGKTSTVRYVLRELERVSINGFYVNCWSENTLYSILDKITTEMRLLRADVQNTTVKLGKIQDSLKGRSIIIILDEIDKPVPKNRNGIIYALLGIRNSGLICICNSRHVYYELDERVKSRLNPRFVEFRPYAVNDLTEILKQRAVLGLAPETWDERLLEKIAELSEGDARTAIQTLKNTAYYAEKSGERKITLEHVTWGYSRIKHLKKTYRLDRLTEHHRLLYNLIKENPSIHSGELWKKYVETCEKDEVRAIAKRTYTKYITELMETGLIKAEKVCVKGRLRSFRAT